MTEKLQNIEYMQNTLLQSCKLRTAPTLQCLYGDMLQTLY